MFEEKKELILNKITDYRTVILCRHIRPDGDAVGSTLGLKKIIEASFPEKRVFIERKDETDQTAFLGSEGDLPSDEDFKDALVIILDTAVLRRLSSDRYPLFKEIIKIDHHIIENDYGDIFWVQDNRNSVCEMITEFWYENRDKLVLTKEAAECLFTGMVTDSGRFRFRGTSPTTMRLAAVLLENGVDYETLYACLDVKDFKDIKDTAELVDHIKLTESGVAYLILTDELIRHYDLSADTSYNAVTLMDNIRNTLVWLVLIQNEDGSFRVRIRSRFVAVEPVARLYSGGGHALAAGATVYSYEEINSLLKDLDRLHVAFKKANPEYF